MLWFVSKGMSKINAQSTLKVFSLNLGQVYTEVSHQSGTGQQHSRDWDVPSAPRLSPAVHCKQGQAGMLGIEREGPGDLP